MAPSPRAGRLERRRKAAVYVRNRESAVRTMMCDTAANPLYPLNVETKWVPANELPPWDPLKDEQSPPSSPVHSPPALRYAQRGLSNERPTSSPDIPGFSAPPNPSTPSEASRMSSVRRPRRLFDAVPQSEARPRWKSANDIAVEPQPARRRRQAAARERRLKRYVKSTAEIVVSAAAAGDVVGLQQWMAVDDSYCNCEAMLPYANYPTSPLTEASKNGHVECCRLLMQRGARLDDLSAATPGWSALMEAAAAGHVSVVNALCGFGADPLLETSQTGTTALAVAAMQGHAGTVAGLLALGGLLPRAVTHAALGLDEVAVALDALEPMRKVMASMDHDLWKQGTACARSKDASKLATQILDKRQYSRESRVQSAQLANADFVWLNTGSTQLRRDFFAWRAETAKMMAEKAHLQAVKMQRQHRSAYDQQELALSSAAAARQDLDETVERVQRSVSTAIQRLELAVSRAALVQLMFAHTDIDGRTPVCHAAVSRCQSTIRVMATCGAGTPGNEALPRALATAYSHKAFAAYRCLMNAQQHSQKPESPQRPFNLEVLTHLRDETHELDIEDDDLGGGSNGPKLTKKLAESATESSKGRLIDSGAWWADWIRDSQNFYQVMQRCNAAVEALQLVSKAARAAEGSWVSGPDKRGRNAALQQQHRHLHRELIARSMEDERAAAGELAKLTLSQPSGEAVGSNGS